MITTSLREATRWIEQMANDGALQPVALAILPTLLNAIVPLPRAFISAFPQNGACTLL